MYRLADKCGIDELKKTALDDIRSKLSADNIVAELRSSLASRYDEVRDVVVEYACQSARPAAMDAVPEWIDDLVAGKSARSADTLKALYKKSVSSTSTSTPQYWTTNRCGSPHP
ncbi:hypothetical protein BC629DRAFT_1456225 [Irpex lacteus]|nr:hypothetical protein BC629DRAFT_1456225 [Irpex lacteus]